MKRLGTIVCRFFFLDGRTKAIDVHPCDTAQDSVSKLADKIGLQSTDGWALFESGPTRESHIQGNSSSYSWNSSSISLFQVTTICMTSSVRGKWNRIKLPRMQPRKLVQPSQVNRTRLNRRSQQGPVITDSSSRRDCLRTLVRSPVTLWR